MSKSLRRFLSKRHSYRVKIRRGKGSFGTTLVTERNPKKAAKQARDGRVISVTKLGMEELYKVGSYFQLGKQLMEEFKEERKKEESIGKKQNPPG